MRRPRMTPVRPRRLAGLTALALAGSLALAACGGSEDSAPSDETTSAAPQELVGGEEVAATWPLTGLEVEGSQSAEQTHPVMVVKMDNTYASAPQLGLGSADLVVEELVEGGLTRLAAFYYSDIPGTVGPVRSMRASDIGIVGPTDGGVMVTSGAAPVTIRRITGADIRFFGEGSKGFFRDSGRSAPYNLFAKLDQTETLVRAKQAVRPPDYLPFGDAEENPAGKPAGALVARFSGGHATEWTFAKGHYVNTNSNAAADDRFPADTVLVLRVQVGDAGYKDPAGNPVPETKFTGSGKALLFHGGRVVLGTWTKSDLTAPLELSLDKGGDLVVPPGRTWVELVPQNGGDVSFAKK